VASTLSGFLDAAGPAAPLGFLLLWIAGTCALVPGTLLCAVGGVLFGPFGILLSLVGSPLGALAAFLLGRRGGRDVTRRLPERAQSLVRRLEGSGARGVFVLRMLPAMPVCALNYALGTTRVSTGSFVVGSALGAAPRIVLYGGLGGSLAAIVGLG
jgi:uncharacterized membrane protein YdjX (TVP38/TMEM64 family)